MSVPEYFIDFGTITVCGKRFFFLLITEKPINQLTGRIRQICVNIKDWKRLRT